MTFDIPSISGKVHGTPSESYLAVTIWYDAGSNFNALTDNLGQQSGTFDIADLAIHAGDTTALVDYFDRHATYEDALWDCLPFYQKSYNREDTPGLQAVAGNASINLNSDIGAIGRFAANVSWSRPLRASPAMVLYPGRSDVAAVAGQVAQYNGSSTSWVASAFAGERGMTHYITIANNWDQISLNYTVDAEITP